MYSGKLHRRAAAWTLASVFVASVVSAETKGTSAAWPTVDLTKELPMTAAYWKRLAAHPPSDRSSNCVSSVRSVRGIPRIVIDGEVIPGMCALPSPYVVNEETTLPIRDFSACGIRLTGNAWETKSYKKNIGEWWIGEGKYDFARFDERFEALFRACPEGWVFPRLFVEPPRWWSKAHPEEIRSGEVKPNSKPWRDLYRRMLVDVVNHVESSPYAARVMGYHLAALHGGEWLVWPFPDEEVPSGVQDPRDPFPPKSQTRARREYMKRRNAAVADALLDSARLVKDLLGRKKLVGVFFGYLNYDHQDMARVLASPDIDFFACPADYSNRGIGQCNRLQAPLLASFRLHGKVYYDEADIRTLYARTTAPYRMKDVGESVNAIKRTIGYSLTGGWEAWWFLLAGNDIFHDERLLEPIRIGFSEEKSTLLTAPHRRADVALFFAPDDYSTCAVTGCPKLRKALRYDMNQTVMPRTGVDYDSYVLSDISDPQLPDYKVYLFVNAFDLTEQQRVTIRYRVRRAGKTAVWILAPGYYRGDSGSVDNVADLTGIKLRESYPVAEGDYARTFSVVDPESLGSTKDGWSNVYFPEPPTSAQLREAFRDAGVHIWSETEDAVVAGRGYVAIHALSDGKKCIRLPAVCDVREIFGETSPQNGVMEVVERMRRGETRVYEIKESGR